VVGGLAVILTASIVTYVVLPLLGRWTGREAAIAAGRERVARLEALIAGEHEFRRAAAEERDAGRRADALLSTGATAPLAAAALQVLLRQYAQETLVQLDRIDVAGQPTANPSGLLALPVTVQGQGDIYGLVGLLDRLQHGERLLVVDEIAVGRAVVRGSDRLLTWTIRVHGLYAPPLASR
jgi:hypothetical protein